MDLTAQTVSQMVDQVLKLPEGESRLLLAPLVADRKGEHAEVLADLGSQGFVRARIDGKVVELDAAPELDGRRKHDDRGGGRPLQGARRHRPAAGRVLRDGAAPRQWRGPPRLRMDAASATSWCSPAARLPGLRLQRADAGAEAVLVQQPGGRLPGLRWPRVPGVLRSRARGHAPAAVAGRRRDPRLGPPQCVLLPDDPARWRAHYGFDIETPWEQLPATVQQLVLDGSGTQDIEFRYTDSRGRAAKKQHPFEGILPNIERRYRETESQTVREELGKYRGTRRCAECDGTRLNRDARHVHVAGRHTAGRRVAVGGGALEFYLQLAVAGWRGEIARAS
jgi:excinuclease ABC subunit A